MTNETNNALDQIIENKKESDDLPPSKVGIDTLTPDAPQAPSENSIRAKEDDTGSEQTNATPSLLSFSVKFLDFGGRPIEGIRHKIRLTENSVTSEFPGRSGSDGTGIKMIECIHPNSPVELWVQRDNGTWIQKYKGIVSCKDMAICAVSPHIKIKVDTELHVGSPSNQQPPAQLKLDPRLEKAPNAPVGPTSGGSAPNLNLTKGRDAQGKPTATATESSFDSNGRNRLPTFSLWSWTDFIQNSSSTSTTPVKSNDVRKTSTADLKKVEELIKVMEQQSTWDWKSLKQDYGGSLEIKNALANKTFTAPDGTKEPGVFHGKCYMSVKVGLWRAQVVDGVGGGEYPSTEAKAWLLSQGFLDVTNLLPDARWAAPADVVVYQYDSETIAENERKIGKQLDQYKLDMAVYPAKQKDFERLHDEWAQRRKQSLLASATSSKRASSKAPQKKDPEPRPPQMPKRPQGDNYGHIDVRTYDGYISDAKVTALPRASLENGKKGFVVNGIFRKFFDPLPELRIRAFLKILREWECHQETDDSKRYWMLGMGLKVNDSSVFNATIKHPFEGTPYESVRFNPAGAYQIIFSTYKLYTNGRHGIPKGFSPIIQDRIAVAIIEGESRGAALAAIRSGNVEKAVDILKRQWSSLPGGSEPRTEKRNGVKYAYTISDLKTKFDENLQELKR